MIIMTRSTICSSKGAACLLVLSALAGCNTTGITEGPDNTVASSMKLTAEQVGYVRESLKPYLNDPENSTFGPMAAGRFPNGQIMVCGHVQTGVFDRWTPYAVYLAGKKAWVGIRGEGATQICRDRGIGIEKQPV